MQLSLGPEALRGVKQVADLPIEGQQAAVDPGSATFAQLLDGLANATHEADGAVEALATGQESDLHDVMLAIEMESMSFELAVEIRNKLVDAWTEIFRMSV